MEFNTKYNHNDIVYYLSSREKFERVPVDCSLCESTGTVKLKGIDYTCPRCDGRTQIINQHTEWYVDGYGQIGYISIENFGPNYQLSYKNTINYMIDVTGVGNGRIYHEDALFTTREEAQKECDCRNEK